MWGEGGGAINTKKNKGQGVGVRKFYISAGPSNSDQQIVIFPVNRNRNRFAEPSFVQIGLGIVREIQSLQIGLRIKFVGLEVYANYSQRPETYFF